MPLTSVFIALGFIPLGATVFSSVVTSSVFVAIYAILTYTLAGLLGVSRALRIAAAFLVGFGTPRFNNWSVAFDTAPFTGVLGLAGLILAILAMTRNEYRLL